MTRSPSVRMRWESLLFLHWRVPVDQLRPLVPRELTIETFDGSAWIGLVPFSMADTRFRGVPDLASLRAFHECNVRTYVRSGERAGVWFFSLDAESTLAVLGARLLWSLPYHRSRFAVVHRADETRYRVRRLTGRGSTDLHWRAREALPMARAGSLEHFLTERSWLFAQRFGRLMRGRVEHHPWPLRRATIATCDDRLVAAAGIKVSGPPHLLASDGVDVLGWSLVPIDAAASLDGDPAVTPARQDARTSSRTGHTPT